MPIQRLLLENYRAFRERQEIELAPVTVVLGKNNSGKSALTRAPLVIATGFDTTSSAPLDLERLGPDAVDDLRELYFDQRVGSPLRLGLTVDGLTPFTLSADLEYVDGLRNAVVAQLRIERPGQALELVSTRLAESQVDTPDIDGVAVSPPPQPRPGSVEEYEIRIAGYPPWLPVDGLVPFAGLIPQLEGFPDLNELSPGPIRYLGPYRKRVARQHRLPIGTPAGLGSRGEGLPGLLAQDQGRADGELLESINEKLARIVPGWRLDEVPAGPLWSTVLVREGGQTPVNLADAGSGLAQVLPILAQCALDEFQESPRHPPLQIIEEPEMHLHPAAHAELADFYLRTARETGTRFLIETHSETLLLRLRRRVAELDNDIGPEMVAIYVVEQHEGVSTVHRVELDDLGNLDDTWPPGYFSQDYHEVRALARAQAERTAHAS